jgi:hypothetical protein
MHKLCQFGPLCLPHPQINPWGGLSLDTKSNKRSMKTNKTSIVFNNEPNQANSNWIWSKQSCLLKKWILEGKMSIELWSLLVLFVLYQVIKFLVIIWYDIIGHSYKNFGPIGQIVQKQDQLLQLWKYFVRI